MQKKKKKGVLLLGPITGDRLITYHLSLSQSYRANACKNKSNSSKHKNKYISTNINIDGY
jgi:hypothetical protein